MKRKILVWGAIILVSIIAIFLIIEKTQNNEETAIEKESELVIGDKNITMLNAGKFKNGLAVISIDKKSGYIDDGGNIIISLQYDKAKEFTEGLAAVKKEGKWGYIDVKGNVVINFQYDDVGAFSEGLASVKKEEKWGYINTIGDVIIDFKYDDASAFSEERAHVLKEKEKGKFIGVIIDRKGNEVINLEQYQDAGIKFSDGLLLAMKGNKFGYIDKQGNIIIDFQYDFAYDFTEGLAGVKKEEKWGYIDTKGNVVIDFQYDFAR